MNTALNILCESLMPREKKQQVSYKLPGLAVQLLKEEAKATGESESRITERAIMHLLADRPAYRQLVREALERDPTLGPLLQSIIRDIQQEAKGKKLTYPKAK